MLPHTVTLSTHPFPRKYLDFFIHNVYSAAALKESELCTNLKCLPHVVWCEMWNIDLLQVGIYYTECGRNEFTLAKGIYI